MAKERVSSNVKQNEAEIVEVGQPLQKKTVTQEEFTNSNLLDAIALNNELMSMNKGELSFTVIKRGNFAIPKKDDKDKTIYVLNPDGSILYDNEDKPVPECNYYPYVDIQGQGFEGRITTKMFDSSEFSIFEEGKVYIGYLYLTTDDKQKFVVKFKDIVPFNQELESRLKSLQTN